MCGGDELRRLHEGVGVQGGERSAPRFTTLVGAAGLAGAGVSAILCPTELVKVRGLEGLIAPRARV